MSRKNRTGPTGMGAMKGKGLGGCTGVNAPVYGGGLGRGCVRGSGRGFGFKANANYNYNQTAPKEALPKNKEIRKMYIDDNCVGCGLCVGSCPVEAISLIENKAVINKEICIECGSCIDLCPSKAIHQED